MQALAVQPHTLGGEHIGGVITRDQPTAGSTFRKGHRIEQEDLAALRTATQAIHLVLLDEGDLTEQEAVPRIAEAIRGENTAQTVMVQGRINVRSTVRGLLRVDQHAVNQLNSHSDIGVFTATDGLAVNPDQILAGVKISPVAILRSTLDSSLAQVNPPLVKVLPFQPLSVVCLVSEALEGRVRDRFEQSLQQKIAWYGAELTAIRWLPDDAVAITEAMAAAVKAADIVLTAGSHMMDPLDATIAAVNALEGRMLRLGAPAHPGSMVWLAYVGQTPVLSLAGCSMFSRSTVADLLMPFLFAGVQVNEDDLASLGYGGLLDRHMEWRFPPYEVEA